MLIPKMENKEEIIMNSKSKIVGSRIVRKKVEMNGDIVDMVTGNIGKLDPLERKLLAELEEGGEEYQDREL